MLVNGWDEIGFGERAPNKDNYDNDDTDTDNNDKNSNVKISCNFMDVRSNAEDSLQ